MNGLLAYLSAKFDTRNAAAEASYDTTGVRVAPPGVSNNPDGTAPVGLNYRFARVEAHSADLRVAILKPGVSTYTIGSGDIHVRASGREIFQIDAGGSLWIAGDTGTATGCVVWGR